MNIKVFIVCFVLSVITLFGTACDTDSLSVFAEVSEPGTRYLSVESVEPAESPLEVPVADIDYETIKPNEMGQIMIVMYHNLAKSKPYPAYQRLKEDFENDLQLLYDKGYRLISLEDLASNNIKVEAGFTPVVFVFDDGLATTFSMTEVNGKLEPTEGCMVDIINKFCEKHPDFGKAGVFAIIGAHENFRGAGTLKERLQYLIDNGFEIANHTFKHKSLKRMSEDQIQDDLAKMHQLVSETIPDYKMKFLVYPFGERPQKELRPLALKGSSGGIEYDYVWALREGQSGASATPGHIDFDPLNVPRVRGSDNASTDLGWFFKYFEKNPDQRYISDGIPNRISVPKSFEGFINREALKDKEIVIY